MSEKKSKVIKAVWNKRVLAESSETIVVEGYQYFPASSIHQEYFKDSEYTSVCKWKGTSTYKHLVVDGKINHDAAWCYLEPKPAAREIAGYFAFWRGVQVGPA
jgi:uncharacterized protein (DUF427 family)